MAQDLPAFQRVLEALESARSVASILIATLDTTTQETDDQDCYPRGIELYIERDDPVWHSLRFLSKHLDWINLDTRTKHLYIQPPESIPFRNTQAHFQQEVALSLNHSGIYCAPHVYYRE